MLRPVPAKFGMALLLFAGATALAYFVGAQAGEWVKGHRQTSMRNRATARALEKMQTIEVGGSIPDFEFEDLAQQAVHLTDAVSGTTVVCFFEPDCHLCIDEVLSLREIVTDSSDYNHLVLISSSDRLDLLEWQRTYGIPCQVLWDRDGMYRGLLRVEGSPFNVVVDSSLRIAQIIGGPMRQQELQDIVRRDRRHQ